MRKTILSVGAAAVVALVLNGCNGAYHDAPAAEKHEAKHEEKHEAKHAAHWDYDENGPAKWGEFNEICEKGQVQSPINIATADVAPLDAVSALSIAADVQTSASVVDNGHAIKVTPETNSKITLNGVDYKLLQFHFHGKSEHTVDGKQYQLCAHMVHQNEKGEYAVIGILYDEGAENPLLKDILGNVAGKVSFNQKDLLPADSSKYFHYTGSFTTPPCSEGVKWYVLKTPQTASAEQLAAFRKYYDHNFRPTLPLNARKVQAN